MCCVYVFAAAVEQFMTDDDFFAEADAQAEYGEYDEPYDSFESVVGQKLSGCDITNFQHPEYMTD
jgi:hypothetical protein